MRADDSTGACKGCYLRKLITPLLLAAWVISQSAQFQNKNLASTFAPCQTTLPCHPSAKSLNVPGQTATIAWRTPTGLGYRVTTADSAPAGSANISKVTTETRPQK